MTLTMVNSNDILATPVDILVNPDDILVNFDDAEKDGQNAGFDA